MRIFLTVLFISGVLGLSGGYQCINATEVG